MILSRKPTTPTSIRCGCGCGHDLELPTEIRHYVKTASGVSAWRYRATYVQVGETWAIDRMTETHFFQPRHRRAIHAWQDSRARLRRALTFGGQPRSFARRSA